MTVSIRPLGERDFFAWLPLFEGYCRFYETDLDDTKALIVWQWLMDPAKTINGLVATDETGELIGLAHYRIEPDTLAARYGVYLDDLYTLPEHRGRGVGRTLIEALRRLAAERGYSVVRWITAADNEDAQTLYDSVASKTSWVTYETRPETTS
jgi:ribosomal protein S18 acetylase RimI-like enzyme